MQSEPKTPLILWICAAVCAHHLLAQGGGVVAKVHDDQLAISHLLAKARGLVRDDERVLELSVEVPPDTVPEVEPDASKPKPDAPKPKPDPARPDQKPDEKKPAAVPPNPEPPKKDPPATVVIRPEPPKAPTPPLPQKDQRIAVRQHAKSNQADNPNAQFIADEANKVDKEEVARQTTHDRNDEHPSPGTSHAGPDPNPGNSDQSRVAESENRKGEANRAPGEKGTDPEVQKTPAPLPTAAAVQGPPKTGQPTPNAPPAPALAPQPAGPAPAPAPAGPNVPPAAGTPPKPQGESWSYSPFQRPAPATSTLTPQAAAAPIFGRGVKPSPGQLNPNLSQGDVSAMLGRDELRSMREADGERRKSEHRGSWVSSSFDHWRSAVENYVSSVQTGNQTALNTARVPFASYLNGMHNRIHPIFADNFLGSLDRLPQGHVLNNKRLVTRLELVLTKDGHLYKMGVVRTSGNTAFDLAALDSVQRAQPFGSPPSVIVSPDGHVYLHWEFHRDEVYACSTMNARPFLLNNPPPKPVEPVQPPPAAPPVREPGAPAVPGDTRQGKLERPRR
ncbi:MAG: TonB C-terminal domain-containing protein [Myxococcales bacterium]